MSRIVLLDSGPLGMVSHPEDPSGAGKWARKLWRAGILVTIPEIADYEVRRELVRAGKTRSVALLDRLETRFYYLPLTTSMMVRAADYWAAARSQGRPSAAPAELDGDVILAAQAAAMTDEGHDVMVATTNPGHLSLFVDARPWQEIT